MLGLKNSLGISKKKTATAASGFENTKSIAFDGVDDYITSGAEVTWDTGSLSFWMKTTDTISVPIFLYATYQYIMCTSTTFLVRWPTHAGAATAEFLKSAYDFSDGNWHHIVITFHRVGAMGGATTTTIYFDGVSVATRNDTETYTPSLRTLIFGAYNASAFHYEGNLDEVAWWNATTLSATEVTALYNNGTPIALDDNAGGYVSSGNLTNWWRMGDGDTYPTLTDNAGSLDGTMTNMTSEDLVLDTP